MVGDGVTHDEAVVSNTGDDDVMMLDLVNDGGGGGQVEEVNDGSALRELLKGVVVGEESYKTPKKGFSSVAISVEIEEFVEVDVGLPPPSVGMVFQSWQELDEYFREYGKQNGFGVIRTSACKVGKGPNAKMRRNCLWTCECFGLPDRKRKKVDASLVTDAQLLDIQVEEKLSMLTRNRSVLLGCNGTPSSVCFEKEASPPDTEKQGICAKDLFTQLATIKDPPIPKKPPHRTTASRYKSCVENSKKPGNKRSSGKQGSAASAGGSQNNLQSSFSQRPPSVGVANSPSQRPFFLPPHPHYLAYQQYYQMHGMAMQMGGGYMSPNTAGSQFPYMVRPGSMSETPTHGGSNSTK
uniref:FAR1 domain-containing protein n=1 Tax=Chenopodium quinoa TaxID=63459 RepID=A0A803MLE9_CHEQI